MLNVIKIEVPSTPEQDFTLSHNEWVDGKLKVSRGATHDTYYILHETREVNDTRINAEGEEEQYTRQGVFALPVVVAKPATYENVINAAERTVYNLRTDAEAISFTASLARRYRMDNQDAETLEHDQFMNSVLEDVKPLFQS